MSDTDQSSPIRCPDSPADSHLPKTVQSTVFEVANDDTLDKWDVEKRDPTPPSGASIDPNSFRDGGLKAWMVVFGGFCGMFVSFGWINCEVPIP